MDNDIFQEIIINFGIRLGQIIAKLHLGGIVHGDLTTSNILLRNGNHKAIVFIDFGLAEVNLFHSCFQHI